MFHLSLLSYCRLSLEVDKYRNLQLPHTCWMDEHKHCILVRNGRNNRIINCYLHYSEPIPNKIANIMCYWLSFPIQEIRFCIENSFLEIVFMLFHLRTFVFFFTFDKLNDFIEMIAILQHSKKDVFNLYSTPQTSDTQFQKINDIQRTCYCFHAVHRIYLMFMLIRFDWFISMYILVNDLIVLIGSFHWKIIRTIENNILWCQTCVDQRLIDVDKFTHFNCTQFPSQFRNSFRDGNRNSPDHFTLLNLQRLIEYIAHVIQNRNVTAIEFCENYECIARLGHRSILLSEWVGIFSPLERNVQSNQLEMSIQTWISFSLTMILWILSQASTHSWTWV